MINIVRQEDIIKSFDNGFSKTEILCNVDHPLVKTYSCTLKSGETVWPELIADRMLFYCFIKGKGYIGCKNRAYNIDELSFFLPDFANEKYFIHAAEGEDLEYILFDVAMLPSDWVAYEDTHFIAPWFKSFSNAEPYTQTCKGPNTKSYLVLPSRNFARILCGVVIANGEGTKEKGHPEVDQWNITLDGADFTLYVEDEEVHHNPFEVSYVKAGLDHGLVADPGKKVSYIWFEHFVEERKINVQDYEDNGKKYGHI